MHIRSNQRTGVHHPGVQVNIYRCMHALAITHAPMIVYTYFKKGCRGDKLDQRGNHMLVQMFIVLMFQTCTQFTRTLEHWHVIME